MAEDHLAPDGSIHPSDHPGGVFNRSIGADCVLFCCDLHVYYRHPAKNQMAGQLWLFNARIDY